MQSSEALLKLVELTLEENKAKNIRPLDVHELTSIADYMVVATATSKRHASAMADKLVRAAKKQNTKPVGVEGENDSEWILIDLGDVIVHIMLPEAREFYSLEKLWSVAETVRQNEN